ncbi:prenyltransferase/squalene oxidase repeat-containing protein [Bacillus velezensis]|nr:prenyltransferase/squalene oxidase repeat-containing protein [Bacillus velezensis]
MRREPKPPGREKAIRWLKSIQNEDGSWGIL